MAYQVKRSGIVSEMLELLDEKGQVIHTLEIKLNIDAMARSINEKYVQLANANQKLVNWHNHKEELQKENEENVLEEVKEALYALYETVFGAENAKIIADFYGDRILEMNMEITPFIVSVIIPGVREAVSKMRQKAAAGYKRKKLM